MPDYRIVIEGSGPSLGAADRRNGQVDANLAAVRLVTELRDNGHTLTAASFNATSDDELPLNLLAFPTPYAYRANPEASPC